MDLSFLIPSKVRRVLLAWWVENPEAQVGVRELARIVKLSPQQVYRELLNLEGWGFLFSSRRGNQRMFKVNTRFWLYPSIAGLFQRVRHAGEWRVTVDQVLDWRQLARHYQKVPIPPSLVRDLQEPRRRPRSFDEEKALKAKGLL